MKTKTKDETPFARAYNAGTSKLKQTREAREVLVAICLDESGSMNSISDATIDAFNEYIGSLYADDLKTGSEGASFFVTLTQFSDHMSGSTPKARVQYEALPLHKVPELTRQKYRPQGNTPLYDAIGHTIRSAEQWQEARLGRRVLLVIQTDGYENCSRDFTRLDVVDMIQRHENRGAWTAIFLGAGLDAYALATTVGVRSQGNTLSYGHTAGQTVATSDRLSSATRFYASSAAGYVPDTATVGSTLGGTISADEEADAAKRRTS